MSAPLIFKAAYLRREEDTFWHRVQMAVPGATETEISVVVESEGYAFPEIAEVEYYGRLRVLPQVQQQVMLAMFPRLMKLMLRYDGNEVAFQLGDATSFIRDQLSSIDAEAMILAIFEAMPEGRTFNDGSTVDIG